jgi:hypothetical protein
VTATVVTRLAQPDAASLLAPPAGTGAGVADLAREAGKLRQRKAMLAALLAAGEMDADEWQAASKVIKNKLAALEARLTAAAQTVTDAPAASLAGREDAAGSGRPWIWRQSAPSSGPWSLSPSPARAGDTGRAAGSAGSPTRGSIPGASRSAGAVRTTAKTPITPGGPRTGGDRPGLVDHDDQLTGAVHGPPPGAHVVRACHGITVAVPVTAAVRRER